MVVTMRFTIVSARTIPELDFVHQTRIPQIAERVINGRVTDSGQTVARSLKNISGGWVIVSFTDHLKHGISLPSQLWRRPFVCIRFAHHYKCCLLV